MTRLAIGGKERSPAEFGSSGGFRLGCGELGSFTSNAAQRIQIPQGVTSFDRRRSQELFAAMNVTAEKAAPEVMALLAKTAAQIKTDNPDAVTKGGPDAATRLLLTTHREELDPQLLNAVQRAGVEPRLRTPDPMESS